MTAQDGSLGHRASKGASSSMLAQGIRIAIQLGSVVVLSRLLAPGDFGLTAMVLAIIGVAEVFRDFGLTQAAAQAPHLTEQQKTNLFWINALIGLTLTLLTFFLSWAVALFYGDSRLVALTQALSVIFLINGLATQMRAQLTRDLRFGQLAIAETVGPAAGLIAAAIAAFLGASYWSIAIQQISGALVTAIMLCFVLRWVPGRYRRGHGMRQFMHFGGFLVLAQVVNYVGKNIDSVLIGIRLGPTDLGFYNRAFQILVVPLNQINAPASRVALPVLARIREEGERFNKYLLTAQSILLQPVVAGFALAAALATPLVNLILGPGWSETVSIFQILAVAGVAQTASYASYWTFLAHGKTKSQLYWSLCSRPFLILSVVVGATFGLEGVAWGYVIGNLLTWPAGIIWVSRVTGVPGWKMFFNGARAIATYGVSAVSAYICYRLLANPVVGTLVGMLAFVASVSIIALFWKQQRSDLATLKNVIPARFRRR